MGGLESEVGLAPGVKFQKSDCSLPVCRSACLQAPAPLASLTSLDTKGLWNRCRVCVCVCLGLQGVRVGVQNSRKKDYPATFTASRVLVGSEATWRGGPVVSLGAVSPGLAGPGDGRGKCWVPGCPV